MQCNPIHMYIQFIYNSIVNCVRYLELSLYRTVILVYVIVWVAVVFGINCASSAGRKLVIVRGAAEHYYCFLPALREQLIQNTTATGTVTN